MSLPRGVIIDRKVLEEEPALVPFREKFLEFFAEAGGEQKVPILMQYLVYLVIQMNKPDSVWAELAGTVSLLPNSQP